MEDIDVIVPDTSVIVEGLLTASISAGKLKVKRIIVHEAALSELEHLANQNKAIGFLGLEELQRLAELAKKKGITLEYSGRKLHPSEIRNASLGEIDSMVRDLAFEADATLFTANRVQAEVARAKGVKLLFEKLEGRVKKLKLEKYFDKETMSAHLRENVHAFAKKGRPGAWNFVKVSEKLLTQDEIREMGRELVEEANIRSDGFIEIEREGSTIIQLGTFRIVLTRPPFSDGWEITAVRPVRKLALSDYNLSEKLLNRISEQAEGILIAGAPGHGKSTFAQALCEHYASKDKIVKTVEAPRDLVLPESITQYSISHGSSQEIHDVLLLSRPDYTIFDEMRNTEDFRLFADMRLSGVGMVGVLHATNPIDAIQRFVGRIELGVIPQVVDTVIFIKDGVPTKIMSLNMTVKVPEGMTEADLARPVVVVNDFETQKLEFELYSYGEETVVVPVKGEKRSPVHKLASQSITSMVQDYSPRAYAEMASDNKCVIHAPKDVIAKIIGKQGSNVNQMERELGVSIEVRELDDEAPPPASDGPDVSFDTKLSKNSVVFYLNPELVSKKVDILHDGDYVMTVAVGKKGVIKIHRKNKIGKILADAITFGKGIEIKLK